MRRYAQGKTAARLLGVAARIPWLSIARLQPPIVCLYHGVSARSVAGGIDGQAFERHLRFLKERCHFVSPHDAQRTRQAREERAVLLTFDDGFRNNAEVVVPLLRRHGIPALFFVTTRHTVPGRYLWFSYLSALERHFTGDGFLLRGEFVSMSPDRRATSVGRLKADLLGLTPHPASMYEVIENELPRLEDFVDRSDLRDSYAGMTTEQIGELAAEDELFTLGGHTVDHPFLTRCSTEEALRQMVENRLWLQELTGRPCATFAYPSGDYDGAVLDACRESGFSVGYSTTPVLRRDKQFEVSRMGMYSPSVDVLAFKLRWGNALRAARMRIG